MTEPKPRTTVTPAMSSPFSLSGKTALVTGAVGGLGQEMVASLAAAGASVAIHHLDQPREADQLAEKLRGEGFDVAVVQGDVTDWEAAAAFVADAQAALGPIDILVNNAGYMAPGRIVDMTLRDWSRTIDVDLTGVFVVSRHVLVGMLERDRGAIINVSSQLAYKGAEDYASYCAAKAGVLGLTRAMAREVGPSIRVNAIAPGPIVTSMTASFDDDLARARTAPLVAGRMGKPHEVSPAVVFLASDAASFIHGETIHINGGGVMS